MIPFLFVGFGVMAVACALGVVLHKNPVTSALFLVLTFCSLAALYLLLQAEFIAMVQVIVYAGAIMVLFLFVIMYLNLRRDVEGGMQHALRRGVGWVLGALLLTESALLLSRGWGVGAPAPENPMPQAGNTAAIGQVLYTRFLFPFEITSILLLVAMVGAVLIARGRRIDELARPAPVPAAAPEARAAEPEGAS